MSSLLQTILKSRRVNRRATGRGELPFHTSVRGTSRKGKSTWVLEQIVAESLRDRYRFTAVIDPVRTLAEKAVQWALYFGFEPADVVIDDMTDLDHPLQIELLGRSDDPNPRIRSAENRQLRSVFIDLLALSSSSDIQLLQTVKELLNLVGVVFQYQREPLPQWMIPQILVPSSPGFKPFKDGCENAAARRKLELIESLWKQSKVEYSRYVLPTLRRLEELFEDDAVKARILGTPYDVRPLIERGGLYVMLGGEGDRISRAAVNILMRRRNLELGRIARSRFVAGLPTPMDVVVDEWQNMQLLQALELVDLNTLLRTGAQWTYVTQNDDTGDDLLNDQFQNACSRQITFYCSSHTVARRAAESMITAIDPLKPRRVLEKKRRVVVDYETLDTESEGFDAEGNSTGIRKGKASRPIYGDEIDRVEELESLTDQLTMLEVAIRRLGIGEYFEVMDGVVTGPNYKPMSGNPWRSDAYGRLKYEDQYQALIASGVLSSALDLAAWTNEPPPGTEPPKAPPPPPPVKPEPKPKSPKKPKGDQGKSGKKGRSST